MDEENNKRRLVYNNELVLLNIYFVAEKESYLSKLKKKKVL